MAGRRTGHSIFKQMSGINTRPDQSITLKVGGLIRAICGDTCVANEHVGKPSRPSFRIPTHSDRCFRMLFSPKLRPKSHCRTGCRKTSVFRHPSNVLILSAYGAKIVKVCRDPIPSWREKPRRLWSPRNRSMISRSVPSRWKYRAICSRLGTPSKHPYRARCASLRNRVGIRISHKFCEAESGHEESRI